MLKTHANDNQAYTTPEFKPLSLQAISVNIELSSIYLDYSQQLSPIAKRRLAIALCSRTIKKQIDTACQLRDTSFVKRKLRVLQLLDYDHIVTIKPRTPSPLTPLSIPTCVQSHQSADLLGGPRLHQGTSPAAV